MYNKRMEIWIRPHAKGSILSLYIQPGASKSMVDKVHGDRLKIKIKAPPVDGEANKCLIEFLAEILKMSKSGIHLMSGESSRQKQVLVELPPEKLITLISV
jgi:uncharacterized protein (TIGR00251 family)